MNGSRTIRRWCKHVMFMASMALLASATANAGQDVLRRTMADIALLGTQMAQRKADAAEIREALADRLQMIRAEARRESKEKGIDTLETAKKNPRLFYNLQLIAEIQAYLGRYTQKIAYYRVACNRLGYLYQQTDDALKIVSTLSGMKIDALVAQAEKILDGYLPEAQTIVIQTDALTLDPPEKIWESLAAGQ